MSEIHFPPVMLTEARAGEIAERVRGTDQLVDVLIEMDLSRDEMVSILAWMCGYGPSALQMGLARTQLMREQVCATCPHTRHEHDQTPAPACPVAGCQCRMFRVGQ